MKFSFSYGTLMGMKMSKHYCSYICYSFSTFTKVTYMNFKYSKTISKRLKLNIVALLLPQLVFFQTKLL